MVCHAMLHTVNTIRRIRQHNGELKGGAKYTTQQNNWKYLLIIESEQFDRNSALCFEWMVKYPTRKKPRPRIYNGPLGRLTSLPFVLSYDKFKDMYFKIKINLLYFEKIKEIFANFIQLDRIIIEVL